MIAFPSGATTVSPRVNSKLANEGDRGTERKEKLGSMRG